MATDGDICPGCGGKGWIDARESGWNMDSGFSAQVYPCEYIREEDGANCAQGILPRLSATDWMRRKTVPVPELTEEIVLGRIAQRQKVGDGKWKRANRF